MVRKSNQVRIIAGQWRGRKLEFPDTQGLRPTADRVRETLFNWLAPVLPGAVCLDLFAGGGALGFEAASRDAAHVVMVEKNRIVFEYLKEQSKRLSARAVELVNADANDYLSAVDTAFDIIFLDPPFGDAGMYPSIFQRINARHLAKPGGLIYLETEKGGLDSGLPDNWRVYRHKQAGQVDYQLLSYGEDNMQDR
jgi:16S rRNA (guanine966-N2)-methyltransferase